MKILRWLVPLFLFSIGGAAQAQHSNTLTWTWTQGTGDPATGYHVFKSVTPGSYTTQSVPYATVSSVTTLTYTDTTTVGGQTWYYVITAFNNAADSPPSNEVKCVTPYVAPTNAPVVAGTSK